MSEWFNDKRLSSGIDKTKTLFSTPSDLTSANMKTLKNLKHLKN